MERAYDAILWDFVVNTVYFIGIVNGMLLVFRMRYSRLCEWHINRENMILDNNQSVACTAMKQTIQFTYLCGF